MTEVFLDLEVLSRLSCEGHLNHESELLGICLLIVACQIVPLMYVPSPKLCEHTEISTSSLNPIEVFWGQCRTGVRPKGDQTRTTRNYSKEQNNNNLHIGTDPLAGDQQQFTETVQTFDIRDRDSLCPAPSSQFLCAIPKPSANLPPISHASAIGTTLSTAARSARHPHIVGDSNKRKRWLGRASHGLRVQEGIYYHWPNYQPSMLRIQNHPRDHSRGLGRGQGAGIVDPPRLWPRLVVSRVSFEEILTFE